LKTRLIDHQNRIVSTKMFDHIVTHDVAQSVNIPPASTQNALLARTGSPAASARIHPVLRRSSPNNPSRTILQKLPRAFA
jgi:hypothetical protein